jgi:UDP-glucose 4-epimerase
MRVLVTGAAGFICGHLIPELLAAGHEVIGVDDLSRHARAPRPHDQHPGYRFVAGDVRDTDLLRDLVMDVDQVVAAAGLVARSTSLHALAYDLLAENDRIMTSTFDAAIDGYLDGHLERVVVLSSTMVYESAAVFPTPEGAQRTSPPPVSTYGFQKLASEYLALGAWEQYRLPYTILRPSSPVGPGEPGALAAARAAASAGSDAPNGRGAADVGIGGAGQRGANHVVPDLVLKVLAGQDPIRIHGDGGQVRSFIAVRDLAHGIRLAMESPEAANEDFNLGRAEGITIVDLARRLWEKLRPGDEFRFVADIPDPYDVPNRVPDVSRARDILGFEATTPLDEMLDEVIAWVQAELGGPAPAQFG